MIPWRRVGAFAITVARGLGIALGRTLLLVGLGLAINWSFILYAAGGIQERFAGDAGPPGVLSSFGWGGLFLIVGVLIPIAYLLVGQQYGAQAATLSFYTRHRDEVVGWLSGVLEREFAQLEEEGAASGAARRRLMESVSGRLGGVPRPVARRLRRTLERSRFSDWMQKADAASAYRAKGISPEAAALAAYLDSQVEAQYRGYATTIVGGVVATNLVLLAILAYLLGLL